MSYTNLSGVRVLEIPELGVTLTVTWEDPRYPKLVVDDGEGVSGYWLHDMERFCICGAYEANECICGVWEEDYE